MNSFKSLEFPSIANKKDKTKHSPLFSFLLRTSSSIFRINISYTSLSLFSKFLILRLNQTQRKLRSNSFFFSTKTNESVKNDALLRVRRKKNMSNATHTLKTIKHLHPKQSKQSVKQQSCFKIVHAEEGGTGGGKGRTRVDLRSRGSKPLG